jgi:NADH dehydrogenase [ubiquinone] 1 alpha subcomplex assembly factor 1
MRFLAVAVVTSFALAVPTAALGAPSRVADFSNAEPSWVVVNDGVMGGVSESRFSQRRGIGTFSGTVRLENNGGFASVRSAAALAALPADATSFDLRVLGDGRQYQFTVETGLSWYWFAFTPPKGKWTTIAAPFDRFQPVTRFGEPTDDAPLRAGATPRRLGILIANSRAERFSLQLDWIAVR